MSACYEGLRPKAPCDLEEVFSGAEKVLDALDELTEMYGSVALVCAFAHLSDRLAGAGVEEKQRVTIARSGKDRAYERAVELFELLGGPLTAT
jgi:hypothetical protein